MKTILNLTALTLLMTLPQSLLAQATDFTFGAPFVIAERSQWHSGQMSGSEPAKLLDEVDVEIKRLSGRLVKLHVVAVSNDAMGAMGQEIQKRYASALPAVTSVVGKLSTANAKFAVDVVIDYAGQPKPGQRVEESGAGRTLHPGSRVYISGQAENAATPEQAATATMVSLRSSLESFGMTLDDAVQVKAFLNPIDSEKTVRAAIEKFLDKRKVPVVVVQWTSNLPIEIELIAAAPGPAPSPVVEYLTPPGMKASPLYARVVKMSSAQTIYIGGLFGRASAGKGAMAADMEVKDVYASLQSILKEAGGDLEHLVKATYYCSSNETSAQLNTLRPNYYNPMRPPAASKAIVDGVGREGRFMTIDMVAAPAKK